MGGIGLQRVWGAPGWLPERLGKHPSASPLRLSFGGWPSGAPERAGFRGLSRGLWKPMQPPWGCVLVLVVWGWPFGLSWGPS